MSTIEAHPVPVQPPQVPPRPALWVVIELPTTRRRAGHRKGEWIWGGFQDIYDNEEDAQEHARENPGSAIFRLPGSGEVQA